MSVMLAGKIDLKKLRFPALVSPKLDGYRAIVHQDGLMSRKMIKIANLETQKKFYKKKFLGLDGELAVGDPTHSLCFNTTQSCVSTVEGSPDVVFHVFDSFMIEKGFQHRLDKVRKIIEGQKNIVLIEHKLIKSLDELNEYEEEQVLLGFEGVMVRSPDGPYKFGRSTTNEQYLLKLKRFEDSEAVILDCYEERHNSNDLAISAYGVKKRSSKIEGMVGKDALGGFVVKDLTTHVVFKVGTGPLLTAKNRKYLWSIRKTLPGKIIKYRFQKAGMKDKPRFVTVQGFRDFSDL